MTSRRPSKKIDPPDPERLPAVLESLLFVAEEPQEIGALAKMLGVPRQRVERAVEELVNSGGRGLFVQRLGDRVQLATTPDAAPYIERFLETEVGTLSRAALETLAIIAYRQPSTRAVVESVRGVNSDHAVATLAARGLIEEAGRAPGPGRPVLFGTTIRFLEYFGLQRPDEMPALPELESADIGEVGALDGGEPSEAEGHAEAPEAEDVAALDERQDDERQDERAVEDQTIEEPAALQEA